MSAPRGLLPPRVGEEGVLLEPGGRWSLIDLAVGEHAFPFPGEMCPLRPFRPSTYCAVTEPPLSPGLPVAGLRTHLLSHTFPLTPQRPCVPASVLLPCSSSLPAPSSPFSFLPFLSHFLQKALDDSTSRPDRAGPRTSEDKRQRSAGPTTHSVDGETEGRDDRGRPRSPKDTGRARAGAGSSPQACCGPGHWPLSTCPSAYPLPPRA